MSDKSIAQHVAALGAASNLRSYLQRLDTGTLRQVAQRLNLEVGTSAGLHPKPALIVAIAAYVEEHRGPTKTPTADG